MKQTITLFFVGFLFIAFALPASGQVNTHDNQHSNTVAITAKPDQVKVPFTGTYHTGSKSGILYDNGPLITHPGTPDVSRVQSGLNMSSYGFGAQLTATVDNRIADEVIVSDTAWAVDSIIVYFYQTGSTTMSTITAINLQVWDGKPGDAAAAVTWGNTQTNLMTATYWSGIYRDTETNAGNMDRPIMACKVATPGLTLAPGTWWIDYQAEGSSASGPWAPPISIIGQTTTGNAVQKTETGWADLLDNGSMTLQGLPFKIYGYKGMDIGTGEPTHDVNMTLYPNPATSQVTISANTTINLVTVVNLTGQVVLETKSATNNTVLVVNDLPAGLYVVSIQTDQGLSQQKLMIK